LPGCDDEGCHEWCTVVGAFAATMGCGAHLRAARQRAVPIRGCLHRQRHRGGGCAQRAGRRLHGRCLGRDDRKPRRCGGQCGTGTHQRPHRADQRLVGWPAHAAHQRVQPAGDGRRGYLSRARPASDGQAGLQVCRQGASNRIAAPPRLHRPGDRRGRPSRAGASHHPARCVQRRGGRITAQAPAYRPAPGAARRARRCGAGEPGGRLARRGRAARDAGRQRGVLRPCLGRTPGVRRRNGCPDLLPHLGSGVHRAGHPAVRGVTAAGTSPTARCRWPKPMWC
jgi:hypothetical protein